MQTTVATHDVTLTKTAGARAILKYSRSELERLIPKVCDCPRALSSSSEFTDMKRCDLDASAPEFIPMYVIRMDNLNAFSRIFVTRNTPRKIGSKLLFDFGDTTLRRYLSTHPHRVRDPKTRARRRNCNI